MLFHFAVEPESRFTLGTLQLLEESVVGEDVIDLVDDRLEGELPIRGAVDADSAAKIFGVERRKLRVEKVSDELVAILERLFAKNALQGGGVVFGGGRAVRCPGRGIQLYRRHG